MAREECLYRAKQCEQLAAQITGEQQRKMLEIATRWRELVEQLEPKPAARAA